MGIALRPYNYPNKEKKNGAVAIDRNVILVTGSGAQNAMLI